MGKKILRKIREAVKKDRVWRTRGINELQKLYGESGIFFKIKRLVGRPFAKSIRRKNC